MKMSTVLTLSEAATLLNGQVSLATLHRHTKAGTLSYSSNPQGNKVVDIAELERVYGPLQNGDGSHENLKQEDLKEIANPNSEPIVAVLREQVALLTSQLETANREKAQVLKILENQTLMLPKPEPETPRRKRRWFGFFRVRK